MASLSPDTLTLWANALDSDINTQLAASVLRTYNAEEALVNRDSVIRNTTKVFNTAVEEEVGPVTDQKISGRCWLFATTNVERLVMAKKLNVKEFQFSQLYLFFYDKLEKANYFLDQFYTHIDEGENVVGLRLIDHLLTEPINDGGQFDMAVNIVEKYGLVPHDLYPDTFSAVASRTLNFLVTGKLREFAEVLQKAKAAKQDVGALRESMQKEIHRLLVVFLGKPPAPSEKLTWDYSDKDGKAQTLELTPLSFYKETLGKDISTYVSLLNDPRNAYKQNIEIDKLGNVVGGRKVRYLNLEADDLAKYAVKRLQNKLAVFFGTHTPIYTDKKRGIMDQALFNYKLIDYNAEQGKASRILFKQSLMTHAMTITGVHLDKEGNPVRWRVENSWGKTTGQDGYYVMDHEYFKEYVYQIVVDGEELSAEDQAIVKDEKKTTVLPLWDPMGALATFRE